MIPAETIQKALEAYDANVGFPAVFPLALEAALEAVAADIWWEGANAVDEEGRMTTRHCPYEEDPRP